MYNVYLSVVNNSDGDIVLSACWTHLRRKFFDAYLVQEESNAPSVCCNLKRDHLRGKLLFKKGPLAMPFHL
ncbi:hypothetical protein CL176_02430 [Suicoccus acidiformans]|uniref:Transposase IS66 central domain-containing protein n=1 Tax=Suicoccus acidiformans TaxID=2036206 RepID=A0A347WIR6_9LACT|nr:hypothetical protein CL176_02430 [Suicoccus acidiformans]